jgi:hypothetical protein
MRRELIAAFTSAALVAVAGCARTPPTVATLRVTPAEVELPFPAFETLTVEVTPQRELPPGAEPQLFLHLIDEPGSVLRTFDMPLPGAWLLGRTYSFPARLYQSALADPLESGTYQLTAGLYDPKGERFALETEAKRVAKLEYAVATVTVPKAGSSLPALRFSGSWLPISPGRDRQVLARRGLDGTGAGTFQIGPLAPPGVLLLRFGPPAGGKLEPVAGAVGAKIRLRSSCGGYEAELPGDTAAETMIEVPAASGAVSCDVEIAPNFSVRSSDDGRLGSAVIEVLAWRPGRAAE